MKIQGFPKFSDKIGMRNSGCAPEFLTYWSDCIQNIGYIRGCNTPVIPLLIFLGIFK